MTRRLLWVNAILEREATQGRKFLCASSDNRGLKASSPFKRLLNFNHAKGSFFTNSTRERRRAGPFHVAYQDLLNGSTLKEAVVSLTDRVPQGTALDPYKYVDVLRRCSKQKDLESVKLLHDHIKKNRLERNPFVANSLLKSYLECGRLQNARALFNEIWNKDIVTWTLMIRGYTEHDKAEDAIHVFKLMRAEGAQPDAVTYLTVLKACASALELNWGRDIHGHIVHDGFQTDVRVCNALVHMYAKCGSLNDARTVFEKMVIRDIISWNAMIGGLAQHGQSLEAFSLFRQMERQGFTPNSVTYLCILSSSKADPKDLAWVKDVHRQALQTGHAQDVSVNNALILMYAKCGSMDDSKNVFDCMTNRNVISWNAMIGSLAEHGRGHEAFSYFQQMQRQGAVSNVATYMNILNSNACEGALEWVKEVHYHAARSGLQVDLRLGSALIHMYAKCGSIEDARAVFDRMEERDVVLWTTMIGGLAKHGLGHEAFSMFLRMQREGCEPNAITYMSILNPCSSTGALEWVKEVHARATEVGLDVDSRVGNALVHMYAKIGTIARAREVFDRMLDRDVVSWSVMIRGLAEHGHGREALRLFEEMKVNGGKPNGPLFVAVLSACNHAGLVEEGRFQFTSMTTEYGIEPTLEHYTCMVDILGRAGHLVEAKHLILSMPMEPDVVTWVALLGACRIHNDVELAELAAKECLKLEAMDPSPYVLLSNMYAAIGNWEQVSLIRNKMLKRGIRKDPGRCWIEVGNKIHHFVSGETSHPEAMEIYATLDSLSKRMKAEGYSPDTRLVLRKIDEEDKESAVCAHSEKLAMAYGLMYVPRGKPIRIYKNLRMCTDCHVASKFISKIMGQEIVARDVNRFHHFKDGVCSCGDYW